MSETRADRAEAVRLWCCDDVDYNDLGGDYYARRADPERQTKRLVAQLERLGDTVTLQEAAA